MRLCAANGFIAGLTFLGNHPQDVPDEILLRVRQATDQTLPDLVAGRYLVVRAGKKRLAVGRRPG